MLATSAACVAAAPVVITSNGADDASNRQGRTMYATAPAPTQTEHWSPVPTGVCVFVSLV